MMATSSNRDGWANEPRTDPAKSKADAMALSKRPRQKPPKPKHWRRLRVPAPALPGCDVKR